jgi:hypothetical protein
MHMLWIAKSVRGRIHDKLFMGAMLEPPAIKLEALFVPLRTVKEVNFLLIVSWFQIEYSWLTYARTEEKFGNRGGPTFLHSGKENIRQHQLLSDRGH